jgi:polyhydroxyalkanoate synthesis regulator phasin
MEKPVELKSAGIQPKENLSKYMVEKHGEVKDEHCRGLFKKQMNSGEFVKTFIEEKVKLDIEYRLEDLKRDIQNRKSPEELIQKVDSIEKFVLSV